MVVVVVFPSVAFLEVVDILSSKADLMIGVVLGLLDLFGGGEDDG
jgi:hypothetical protein